MEFVADKSYKSEKDYKSFLEDMGYKVLFKNANLNWSIGKVKWRLYGTGMGQISTNPGSYNKELLIVEKKNDGKPFDLYTSNKDKAVYYKKLRNVWLSLFVLLLLLSVWQGIVAAGLSASVIVFGIVTAACFVPTHCYQKRVTVYSKQGNVDENEE